MATNVIKKSLLFGLSAIAVIGIVGFSYSVYQDYKEVEKVADAKNSFTFYEMCRETFEGSRDSKVYCSEKFITHEKLSVEAYEKCKNDYYSNLMEQGFNTRYMDDPSNKKG